VLPVSDDGGSTAEIVRVLGGPAVGDIRSRCLRLADDSDDEVTALPWVPAGGPGECGGPRLSDAAWENKGGVGDQGWRA
jgi:2-phospho-L-lactate transferase CofD